MVTAMRTRLLSPVALAALLALGGPAAGQPDGPYTYDPVADDIFGPGMYDPLYDDNLYDTLYDDDVYDS